MQQIIVLRCEFKTLRGLAVEQHGQGAAYIGSTFFCSHEQSSESHDRGLRFPDSSSASTARPVVSMLGG
jgi:hypothetical protein